MDKMTTLRLMVDDVNIELGTLEYLDFVVMDEFDVILNGEEPSVLVRKAQEGCFNINDDYFSWNDKGNLISFSAFMTKAILEAYMDEIVLEYLKLGHDDYGYLGDLGITWDLAQ